jgi:hypothetical protein
VRWRDGDLQPPPKLIAARIEEQRSYLPESIIL